MSKWCLFGTVRGKFRWRFPRAVLIAGERPSLPVSELALLKNLLMLTLSKQQLVYMPYLLLC